jgi:thioredoxin reductase
MMSGGTLITRRLFLTHCAFGIGMIAFAQPPTQQFYSMSNKEQFDVIIIGGSYSGLAAAMALGRALRNVLVIDNGKPCNRQTPHSHNFLTQDGKTPKEIATVGKQQVEKYQTVKFLNALATFATKIENGFSITTDAGDSFKATKLIFATGVRDIMPEIKGVAECWGISVIHCPYCHGYEVRGEKTGILGNGEYGFEFSQLISNWTNDLTLFTNGKSTLTNEQTVKIKKHNISIVEQDVDHLEHDNGQLKQIVFKDGSATSLKALYTRVAFEQHCTIPQSLGCDLTEDGYIKVDPMQKTTVDGVYACGDNVTRMRTVANAVAMGTTAGAVLNREMVVEAWNAR